MHLNTGQMRQAIARNRVELARLRAERDALKTERDAATTSAPRRQQIRARIAAIAPRVAELDGENGKLGRVLGFASGGDSIERAAHEPKLHIDTGLPALDARIRHVLQSPELFLYRVQSSAYKFSWLLIPISLPFIWLVFAWRRDVGPYDHAIFAIYSLSAMTIGVAGLSMLRALGVPQSIIGLLFVFGPPFHIYKQLRGAYRVGRFGALWRTVALLVSATIAGVLFTLAILGVAA